jgi:hypothetical protein
MRSAGVVVLVVTAMMSAGCGIVVRKDLGASFSAAALPGVVVHDQRPAGGITLRGLSPYNDRIETVPAVADVVAGALSKGIGELRMGDEVEATVTTAMCIVKNELVIGYADFSLEVEAHFTRKGVRVTRTLSVSRAGDKIGAGLGGVDFQTLCTNHFRTALEILGQQARQAYLDGST